jgi:hypothetical protein
MKPLRQGVVLVINPGRVQSAKLTTNWRCAGMALSQVPGKFQQHLSQVERGEYDNRKSQ